MTQELGVFIHSDCDWWPSVVGERAFGSILYWR